MSENTTLFGMNLRRAIIKKGLKFTKAAADLEISLSFLNQLMKGERDPSSETLSNICATLGVSRAELYEEEPPSKSVADISLEELSEVVAREVRTEVKELLEENRFLRRIGEMPITQDVQDSKFKRENEELRSRLMELEALAPSTGHNEKDKSLSNLFFLVKDLSHDEIDDIIGVARAWIRDNAKDSSRSRG